MTNCRYPDFYARVDYMIVLHLSSQSRGRIITPNHVECHAIPRGSVFGILSGLLNRSLVVILVIIIMSPTLRRRHFTTQCTIFKLFIDCVCWMRSVQDCIKCPSSGLSQLLKKNSFATIIKLFIIDISYNWFLLLVPHYTVRDQRCNGNPIKR